MPRILLVDDSPLVLALMRLALEEGGFAVETARGGREALDQIAQLSPDVVVSDLEMPDVSGIDVVRHLRERSPSTPVLILTEHTELPIVVEAMREGAFGYLRKGLPEDALIAEVRAACRHRALAERNRQLEEANRRYQAQLEEMVEAKTAEVLALQRAQAQSEKMAALGTLLAGVAHEINNPLAVIQANARWMQQALVRGEREEIEMLPEVVGEVRQSAERIQRLIDRLRRIIRPGETKGVCDLRTIMDQVELLARPQLAERRAVLSRRIDVELSEVALAEDDMVSALSNLVVNACHAVEPSNGRIDVVMSRAGAGWVEIRVSDNGCGIPPENVDKVFNPFFTTKGEKGTGLGLSLVYQIVSAAHGEVSIDSAVGRGTTLTLRLPDGQVALPAQSEG